MGLKDCERSASRRRARFLGGALTLAAVGALTAFALLTPAAGIAGPEDGTARSAPEPASVYTRDFLMSDRPIPTATAVAPAVAGEAKDGSAAEVTVRLGGLTYN